MSKIAITAVILVAFLAGIATVSAQYTCIVVGNVTDALTGMPIAGATVEVINAATGSVVNSTTTAADGTYGISIDGPSPWTMSAVITASATDYQDSSVTTTLTAPSFIPNFVTIDFSLLEAVPPTVSVLSPNGGENWTAGSVQTIGWGATDASGIAYVDIEYSTDGGVTWDVVATGVTMTGAIGTYTWTVPNIPATSNNCYVRVTAYDNAGNSASDVSDAPFTIFVPLVVTSVVVNPATASLKVGNTQVFTATAYDQYGNPMPGVTFTWSVSNPAVGTLNTTAGTAVLFTAIAKGSTTVTATANGVTSSASVTVTAKRYLPGSKETPTPAPTTPAPAQTPTPPVETPPAETPPVETPPAETPPVETPPVETPPAETPPVETPTPTPGFEAAFAGLAILTTFALTRRRRN